MVIGSGLYLASAAATTTSQLRLQMAMRLEQGSKMGLGLIVRHDIMTARARLRSPDDLP